MSRFLTFWIALTMTLSAALSMALEIVAGRLLAPYVGMSLYSWTAIIAVVLAGLSLGHWIGGVMGDRLRRPGLAVALVLIAAAAGSFASLFILRAVAPATLAAFDPISGIGVLAMAAFFLPSVFAGILSPILTTMALDAAAPEQRSRVLGRMFALGALGAILGTVGAGFWLISWIGSHDSVLLIAFLYAGLAVPFLGRAGRVAAGGVMVLALAGAVFGPGRVSALTSPCHTESAYFCIRIDPLTATGRPARIMVLDHLAHGINDRDDPTVLISPYLQVIDEILDRRLGGRAPEAFFVGGGAFTLPRAWAARFPDARLTVAEIDPEVTARAASDMWLDTAPMEIIHEDGRMALARLAPGRRFDVVVGDAFHDISIPQHLVTVEFHDLIRSRLKPGGFYAANVIEALREPPFLLSYARTLQQSFAHVELWIFADELGPVEKRTTWIIVASDRPTGAERIDSSRGYARTWLRVPTEAMARVIPAERQIVLTDDYAPVDRLMSHILFDERLAE